MMRFATRTFIKGLVVVLPIAAAVYIVIWIVRDSEALVKGLLLAVMPEDSYVPGLGLALIVGGIFCVGLLMYPWITRKLVQGVDAVLRRIPLFGMIYNPVRDLMEVLGGDVEQKLGQVVLFKIPNTDIETVGFVTREDVSDLPEGLARDNHVVVYVQMGYQVGGFTFVVPRDAVRPVDMTVEQGMRWALTAGISAPGNAPESQAQQNE